MSISPRPQRHPARLGRLVALAAAAVVVAVPTAARALEVDVTTATLDNGMQVIVIPDRRAPVVTHMVWYRVGAADEPQGKAGIAHFLEHLMFKGTDRLQPGEFSRLIRTNGGEDNAFTSKDYTAYFQRIAADRLELVMELEASRMTGLKLTDADVATERDVVKEERRQRTDNNPASLLSEQMDAALYVAHPYRKPVIGWMPEVEALTRADALDFYRRFYTPANAALIVAGDVEPAAVMALARKHYGPIANTAEPPARVRTAEPEPLATRRLTMTDPRVSAPELRRSYLAPSYATAEPGEAEALDILAHLLGSGPTSRLYRGLVNERRVAVQAGTWYASDALDGGDFNLYLSPVPGGDIAAAEAAADDILAKLLAEGVTQAEVDRARDALIAATVYALDSQYRLANLFGVAFATGQSVDDVLGWTRRIEAVSVDDVVKAARKVLRPQASVTGILLPAAPTAPVQN